MKKGKLLFTSVVIVTTLFNVLAPLGKFVFANENSEKKMYEVGETEDGKVILSSAKKLMNSRAVGNVQGDVIRVTIGGVLYEGARITIDGKPAFCIDRELRAPWEIDTPYDSGSPFDNKGAKAIMSYGAYSSFYPSPSDEEVLLTEIALHNYLTGKHTQESAVSNTHPFVWNLIQKALAGDVPETKVNFSKTSVKSDIVGNEQVSEEVTLEGTNNQVTIDVPVNVTFVNNTTGQKITNGKATVKAGEKFQLKAPLTYNKAYNTGNVKPDKGEFIPIMFTPFPAGYQRLLQGLFSDPTPMIALNVDFFARTGDIKVTKLDKGTGETVPNTEFDLKNLLDNNVHVVKTDSKGEGLLKDILHDTEVEVTETFVPEPYILAKDNTKKVVVKAGEVTPVEFENERATGKTTLTKQDATTESNEPLNPTYPLDGAKYGLFKEDGKDGVLVEEFDLGNKLTATKDKLELDTYFWMETKAPVGYKLDKTKHVVELKYKDQYTPVVVVDALSFDDVIRMNLDGQKVIQNDTNEMFKNGVEFTMTNQRTGEEFVVTSANVDGKAGYFRFADLPLDDYVLNETKGVDGYRLVDPIEIKHSYNKETESFTFTITDQKTGSLLHEEMLTQLELSEGINVDLGTYLLKNKAIINEKPIVAIATQAHTGDGKTQSFTWGDDLKAYDDVQITHKNIPTGTSRAFETIQVAVYTDKDGKETEKDVWTSGKIDYTVLDKELTERVLSEYDYKKDPEGTRYYFKELGYSKTPEGEYLKDAEHNFDGKEKTQDITPEIKELPKETPVEKGALPNTGEKVLKVLPYVGTAILLGVASFYIYKNKKRKKEQEKN